MARELWEEKVNRLHSLPNKDDEFCKLFTLLGDQDKSLDEILDNIINIIDYSVKKEIYMARKCFFSFHYTPDNWRVSQVRNIGAIEGNKPAKDNDWETVVGGETKR